MIELLATLLCFTTWLMPVALVSPPVHDVKVDVSLPACGAAPSAVLPSTEIRNKGEQSWEGEDPPPRSLPPMNTRGLAARHSPVPCVACHLCASATARDPGWVRDGVVVIRALSQRDFQLPRQGEFDPVC
jgi:hypothetical protein